MANYFRALSKQGVIPTDIQYDSLEDILLEADIKAWRKSHNVLKWNSKGQILSSLLDLGGEIANCWKSFNEVNLSATQSVIEDLEKKSETFSQDKPRHDLCKLLIDLYSGADFSGQMCASIKIEYNESSFVLSPFTEDSAFEKLIEKHIGIKGEEFKTFEIDINIDLQHEVYHEISHHIKFLIPGEETNKQIRSLILDEIRDKESEIREEWIKKCHQAIKSIFESDETKINLKSLNKNLNRIDESIAVINSVKLALSLGLTVKEKLNAIAIDKDGFVNIIRDMVLAFNGSGHKTIISDWGQPTQKIKIILASDVNDPVVNEGTDSIDLKTQSNSEVGDMIRLLKNQHALPDWSNDKEDKKLEKKIKEKVELIFQGLEKLNVPGLLEDFKVNILNVLHGLDEKYITGGTINKVKNDGINENAKLKMLSSLHGLDKKYIIGKDTVAAVGNVGENNYVPAIPAIPPLSNSVKLNILRMLQGLDKPTIDGLTKEIKLNILRMLQGLDKPTIDGLTKEVKFNMLQLLGKNQNAAKRAATDLTLDQIKGLSKEVKLNILRLFHQQVVGVNNAVQANLDSSNLTTAKINALNKSIKLNMLHLLFQKADDGDAVNLTTVDINDLDKSIKLNMLQLLFQKADDGDAVNLTTATIDGLPKEIKLNMLQLLHKQDDANKDLTPDEIKRLEAGASLNILRLLIARTAQEIKDLTKMDKINILNALDKVLPYADVDGLDNAVKINMLYLLNRTNVIDAAKDLTGDETDGLSDAIKTGLIRTLMTLDANLSNDQKTAIERNLKVILTNSSPVVKIPANGVMPDYAVKEDNAAKYDKGAVKLKTGGLVFYE